MTRWTTILLVQLAGSALLYAADPLQPRKGEVPAAGLYVPVSVERYASHKAGAGFDNPHVVVSGVPGEYHSPDPPRTPLPLPRRDPHFDWLVPALSAQSRTSGATAHDSAPLGSRQRFDSYVRLWSVGQDR